MKHYIPKLKLETGRIDLWFSFSDEINDPGLLSAYENYLSISEKQKMQRFHFHKHRHQFLITRALVRTTLSRYFDINPELWRFSNNEYEKPEVVFTGRMPPIRFNISHTDGLVACAVALEEDIGVDVEDTTKQNISVDIADKYFSLQEASDLYSVPEAERKQRFFTYWTLKESFVKAVGKGLSIPLDEFSFHL
ncbi:MAG: 4'-phosphopantetheinyl transferase superfamily protein, partial [Proteobacteria bacterium]|nr:4'-phosphopantetheinyl transferase superfamily protein [Pseudomonadota bacterium]